MAEGREDHGSAECLYGSRRQQTKCSNVKQEVVMARASEKLTGGRVGREVSDHGTLQSWNPPAEEHQRISSNDPWEKSTKSEKRLCGQVLTANTRKR